MTVKELRRRLVGRTIVAYEANAFDAGRMAASWALLHQVLYRHPLLVLRAVHELTRCGQVRSNTNALRLLVALHPALTAAGMDYGSVPRIFPLAAALLRVDKSVPDRDARNTAARRAYNVAWKREKKLVIPFDYRERATDRWRKAHEATPAYQRMVAQRAAAQRRWRVAARRASTTPEIPT